MSATERTPSPGRFIVTSLGCKVNQAEAAWLEAALRGQGLEPAGKEGRAGLAVLFTCSVTGPAARQSRQMARRLAAAHPGARVVVTGCDIQAEPGAYRREGFTLLGRWQLARAPELLAQGVPPSPLAPPAAGEFCPGLEFPGSRRTRGLLKVQDGCDAGCAYCIVPSTRGRSRSLEPGRARELWQELGRAGAREVVLTGIHLGRYGRDLEQGPDLAGLLELLLAAHPGPRLRLSSLEASEINPRLLELLDREDRLCPHLHLPLQSGCDQVLRAMGRPYRARDYAAVVEELARDLPGLCLGADVLVGLPGEDREAFEQTLALVERLPLAYLHVFPYSPRPGTPAAGMERPAPPVVKERAARLRRLGREKHLAFLQRQLGRTLEVVVEGSGQGRSQNYCLVELDRELPPGSLVRVEVAELAGSRDSPCLRGRLRPL